MTDSVERKREKEKRKAQVRSSLVEVPSVSQGRPSYLANTIRHAQGTCKQRHELIGRYW